MRYKKLLVVVLSIAMVFAFAACGSNDKGSADNGDKKNVSDKLEFKGKWVKAGPLKMGFPKGWYMGKNDIFSSKDRSSIDMRDSESYTDDSKRIAAEYTQYNTYDRDYTLEQLAEMNTSNGNDLVGKAERVKIGGLTYIKYAKKYSSSDIRTIYLYRSGKVKDGKNFVEIKIEIVDGDANDKLLKQIVNSVRVKLPKKFEKVKDDVVKFKGPKTGGKVNLNGLTVDVPDDWSILSSDKRSAEFTTKSINDGSVSISTYESEIFGNAQKNANSLAGNFRNEYPVVTKDIGSLHLIGLNMESQFYMCVDWPDGSHYAKISGIHCTLDQAKPLIEKISFK